MSLYPQKWHLPDEELTEDGFHRVRSVELVPGHYYYVHVERPGSKGKSKSKTAATTEVYDVVGQLMEDEELDPAYRTISIYTLQVLYRRKQGKKWTSVEEETESFIPHTIDAEDASASKTFFYMQRPPAHVPGKSPIYPSPGTYHYNWTQFMNAQRKGESVLRFTSKQANRKTKSKSRRARRTRKNYYN